MARGFESDFASWMAEPDFADTYKRSRGRIDAIDEILRTLDSERERRGLAKADLARKLNLDPAEIRRLFTGSEPNPKIGRLVDLAHALDLQVTLTPRLAAKGQAGTSRLSQAATRRSAGLGPDTPRRAASPTRTLHR